MEMIKKKKKKTKILVLKSPGWGENDKEPIFERDNG